jgi:hypothetical protein
LDKNILLYSFKTSEVNRINDIEYIGELKTQIISVKKIYQLLQDQEEDLKELYDPSVLEVIYLSSIIK